MRDYHKTLIKKKLNYFLNYDLKKQNHNNKNDIFDEETFEG